MAFDVDSFARTAAGVRTDDLGDLAAACARRPLSAEGLRCLRYMHDVESHTVCCLSDLLMTSSSPRPADHDLPDHLGAGRRWAPVAGRRAPLAGRRTPVAGRRAPDAGGWSPGAGGRSPGVRAALGDVRASAAR
jgi:hypothetical protein